LRYWEQELTQLKPVNRRGNRRYYQHHEVPLIRRIRELLYEQGFTISGARNRLEEHAVGNGGSQEATAGQAAKEVVPGVDVAALRNELYAVLDLLDAKQFQFSRQFSPSSLSAIMRCLPRISRGNGSGRSAAW